MSIMLFIVMRRKKIISKFETTNTIDENSAKSLQELNLVENKDIDFLVSRGTLVKKQEEKYYLVIE